MSSMSKGDVGSSVNCALDRSAPRIPQDLTQWPDIASLSPTLFATSDFGALLCSSPHSHAPFEQTNAGVVHASVINPYNTLRNISAENLLR